MTAFAVATGSYLLGSIPFSLLVARRFGVPDVRLRGSGNVGATNVLRTAGKLPGALALLLDAGKGAAAVLLARRLFPGETLPALAAVATVVGHLFPVWLGFRGGKGVATGAGAFAPLLPQATAGAVAVFVAVAGLTRYVSLGSISAACGLAGFGYLLGAPAPRVWAAAVVALLVVVKHRGNLARLRAGAEGRVGDPHAPEERPGA